MNDQNQQTTQEVSAPPLGNAPSSEVEAGKAFAVLSYALSLIGVPFFLVPLIMRSNEFSLYHAKQCLLLWLGGIAVGVVGGITMIICVGFVLLPAGMIALLVLNIIGLINAINGQQKPLPLIGPYAEQWFKGITKV